MNCRKCQSTDFVKNGHINKKQRYKCKDCDYQWTENHKHQGRPLAKGASAVFLYCHGLSMSADVSSESLLSFLRKWRGSTQQSLCLRGFASMAIFLTC